MDDAKRAATLMEVSYGNLDYVDSYTAVSNSSMNIYGATAVTTVTTKMQGWLSGKFAINYSSVHKSTGQSQVRCEFGHESGKTYIVPENSDKLLWNEQSELEFILKFNRFDMDDYNFIFNCYEGAQYASASQKNNKLWRVYFKDFSDEWLRKFEGMISDVKPLYEAKAELGNVTVSIDIDSEMRLEKLNVTFKFNGANSSVTSAISFNYNVDLYAFDATKVEKKTFDKANEAEDFDKIDDLIDDMELIPEKKKGKITVNSDVSINQNGVSKKQSSSVILNFDNNKNKLSYNMSTLADGKLVNTVEYADGKYKLNEDISGTSFDGAERIGLLYLINIAELSRVNYESCKITKQDTDTVYELTLSNPDISAYSTLAQKWDEVDAKLKITVAKDGTVKKYVYTLNLSKQGTTVESKYVVTTSLTNAR